MERLNYYNPNIKCDRKALTEVYEILEDFENAREVIPEKYYYVIEDNMDKEYEFDIEEIECENLREDTKKIITYLYTYFLGTPEEREVLQKLEKIQSEKKKNEYEISFNNNQETIAEETEEKIEEQNMQMTQYKESIFTKILNSIKRFFLRFK